MTNFPGFPCNNFDFMFEHVGPALAGLIVRDSNGDPRAGLLPAAADVLKTRSDWFMDYSPFVAVRVKDKSVLIGGTTELGQLEFSPAPTANARIDVVYSLPADMDAGEDNVPLAVATGIPGAVPSKPAIPAGAVEIGTLRLPSGAANTSGGAFTPTFATTVTAGGVIPFRTTAERNGFLALPGQLCLVGNVLYRRVGTSWEAVVPVINPVWNTEMAVQNIAANSTKTVSITFPTGMFASVPKGVQATPRSGSRGAGATVNNLTKTGCDVHFHNVSSIAINMGVYLTVTQ